MALGPGPWGVGRTTPGALSAVNVAAGTTNTNATNFSFSDANGVSFGISGKTITGSVNAAAGGSINFSAAGSSNNVTNIVFSNSNNVTFGLNGSTITASASGGAGAVNFSAGTTSSGLGSVVFSNSNGLAFGLNGSTITGSYTVPSVAGLLSNIKVSAGTTSNNLSALTLADSNGLAFGLSGSVITGSYTVPSTAGLLSNIRVSAGTSSANLSAVTFADGSGVSFGLSGSVITASIATAAPGAVTFSAGASSGPLGSVVFSNSNGLAFGLNASTITGSYTVPSTAGLLSNMKVSAGTSSTNLSAVTFADSNGVSFGLNGSVITGSIGSGVINVTKVNSYWMNSPLYNTGGAGGGGLSKSSGSSIIIQPLMIPYNVSFNFVRFMMSAVDSNVGTAGTTSANTTFSVQRYTTIALVLYSNGVGASSRSLQYMSSTSQGMTNQTLFSMGNGAGASSYTIHLSRTYPASGVDSNYGTSYGVNSASIVISSNSNTLFTNLRYLDIAWANSLAPGNYWLALGESTSSNSNSANISFAGTVNYGKSLIGITQASLTFGIPGVATATLDQGFPLGQGYWTTNASLISTSSLALSDIIPGVSLPMLPIQLIRQA